MIKILSFIIFDDQTFLSTLQLQRKYSFTFDNKRSKVNSDLVLCIVNDRYKLGMIHFHHEEIESGGVIRSDQLA